MKYTVTRRPLQKQKLAEIWFNADDRPAVTAAASPNDVLLRVAPLDQGESRFGNVRIMFESLHAVPHEVHVDDRRGDILSLYAVTKRPPQNPA